MANKALFAFAVMAIAVPNTPLEAQEGPRQAINICAIAIPVMNLYVINYEYLYRERHGLATRVEYAPGLSGSGAEGTGLAAVANYRWHLSPKLEHFFVGAYGRYRYVYGSGDTGADEYDFTVPELNLGLNAGYRWISRMGINAVISFGYGFSFVSEDITPLNDSIEKSFRAFKEDNDAFLDAPFYGEVSFGFAFR